MTTATDSSSLTRTRLRSSRAVSPDVQQHFPLRPAPVEFKQSLRCLLKREAPPEYGLELAGLQERQKRSPLLLQIGRLPRPERAPTDS